MNLRLIAITFNIKNRYKNEFDILIKALKIKYETLDTSEVFIIQTSANGKYYGLTKNYHYKSSKWRICVFIPREDLQYVNIPKYITEYHTLYHQRQLDIHGKVNMI